MKSNTFEAFILSFALALIAALSPRSLAHDNTTVHPAIAESAARSSSGLKCFLADYIGGSSDSALYHPKLSLDPTVFGGPEHSPLEWIKEGSDGEDYPETRGIDHFYDPTKKPAIGLTDPFPVRAVTHDSFTWASTFCMDSEAIGGTFTWPDVRACELSSLISVTDIERQRQLAKMLFCLGHVLHVNQDLTSPMHVRNDDHLDKIPGTHWECPFGPNFTERYGKEEYFEKAKKSGAMDTAFPLRQHGWLWWKNTAKFQKLEDFWNRDLLRSRLAAALNEDASGSLTLGLAEFSNGNFISEDASYRECVRSGDEKHSFLYPSRDHGTSYRAVWQNPMSAVDNSFLKDGSPIKRVYLGKIAQGVQVPHHSVLGYLDVMTMTSQGISMSREIHTPTINDNSVLQDYHSILIPKAIEYSAGILDYFFRGTIVGAVGYDTGMQQSTVAMVNNSSQDFFGGSFSLYQDDAAGERTLVAQTNHAGYTLATGKGIVLTFSGLPLTNKLLLVYQGTIGVNGSTPLDPVDANIAVAAGPVITNWHSSFTTNGATIMSAGERLQEGWVVDFGQVDIDNQGPAYEGAWFVDLNGLQPGGISTDIPVIPGKSYTLSFAYARNPDSINSGNGIIPRAQILINGTELGTVTPSSDNRSWATLVWQTASYQFTATTAAAHLTFQSLNTDGAYGVLIDAIDLKSN